MDDFLARLDAAGESEVPALCLSLADWLSERGDPEAEGWRALGMLGKVPYRGSSGAFFWFNENSRYSLPPPTPEVGLPKDWSIRLDAMRPPADGEMRFLWPSRSIALRVASQAFVGLEEWTQREILGAQPTTA